MFFPQNCSVISYRDSYKPNEEVKRQNWKTPIGARMKTLLTSVKKGAKLKWYGHVHTIIWDWPKDLSLQGNSFKEGGQKRQTEENDGEDKHQRVGLALEWNIILQKAENREEWRES